jgi:hypothetical protein
MTLSRAIDCIQLHFSQAPWSPRASMGLVTQYFKPVESENGYWRMVLIGGYGGYPAEDIRSDGDLRCRSDVWSTLDGINWNQSVAEGPFGGIGFMGVTAWEPNVTTQTESPY